MNENGQVVVGNVTEYVATQSRPGTGGSSGGSSSSDWMSDDSERDDDADYAAGSFGDELGAWERNDVPILLYLHEVLTCDQCKSHCSNECINLSPSLHVWKFFFFACRSQKSHWSR